MQTASFRGPPHKQNSDLYNTVRSGKTDNLNAVKLKNLDNYRRVFIVKCLQHQQCKIFKILTMSAVNKLQNANVTALYEMLNADNYNL
jgi:hypothetical protein